jgi:hypothetical protein
MLVIGSSTSPVLNAGFSSPSYSNFESMICTEAMLEGLSLVPSRRVLALKTGMNSEKGRKMSCHSPGVVSKLLQDSYTSLVGNYPCNTTPARLSLCAAKCG